MSKILRIFSVLFMVLAVTACRPVGKGNSGYSPSGEYVSTEDLLDAEGAMVVEDKDLEDPLQAHMRARQQVNPNQTGDKRSYTTEQKQSAMNAERHVRVLRVSDGDERSAPSKKVASKRSSKIDFKPAQGLKTKRGGEVVSGAQVSRLRTGEHPGFTRLVFDCSQSVAASYNFESGNKVLRIDFKNAQWSTQDQKQFLSHPLLEGYSVEERSGAAHMVLKFKRSAKVKRVESYGPTKTHSYYRIVVDVARL